MFCPSCKSEFRPGFTRCASCGVDLVEDLDGAADAPSAREMPPRPVTPGAAAPMVSYCGFLQLDDAREARARLREAGVSSEIVIRDAPEDPGAEEYWLRVPQDSLARVSRCLGDEDDR